MTTTPLSAPRWKLTSPSALCGLALAAFLLFLGARGAFDAIGAADGFGVPLASAADAPWLHVKADRDLARGLVLLPVLLWRERRIFGAVTLACVIAPVIDAATVISHGARSVGYALAVHGSAVVYGLVLGAWLLATESGARRAEAA
jgi:hypothetical protein